MRVTSNVPPITSTAEGVSTNEPTEPPRTIAVADDEWAPTRPIRVARSKRVSLRP